MSFHQNLNTAGLAQLDQSLKNLSIFLKTEDIATRMAVDKHGVTLCSEFELFFLGCVIVAGIYGAATVSRRIFFVQAVPALLAMVAVSAA